MSIYTSPNESFEASVIGFPTGLLGTLGVQILDTPAGDVITPRTTAGITEEPAGSGYYTVVLTAPVDTGTFTVFWDNGSLDPSDTAAEDLIVGAAAPVFGSTADLTTVTAVREFLQKPGSDTSQDSVIANLISRASRAILTDIGIEGAPTAETSHVFVYTGGARLNMAPYVAQSVDSVVMDSDGSSPSTLATDGWALRPKPPRDGVYRYLRLPGAGYGESSTEREVTVTGVWGWPTVPHDVEHWCIVTVAEWLRLHVQAFSTVLNIDAQLLERPEALPSAVRAGLGHHRQVLAP